MRIVVLIVGIIAFFVGVCQVVTAQWCVGMTRAWVSTPAGWWLSIVGIVIGAIIFYAAHMKLIGLKAFTVPFGLMVVIFSCHYVVDPQFWARFMSDVFFDRSMLAQTNCLVITGLIRIVCGTALVYAAQEPAERPSTA